MMYKILILTIAAMFAAVTVADARVHHRHGWHRAYGYMHARSNPTNTNGF